MKNLEQIIAERDALGEKIKQLIIEFGENNSPAHVGDITVINFVSESQCGKIMSTSITVNVII
jgi:hypothetical protein